MRQFLLLLTLVMLVTSCTTKNEAGSLLNEPVTEYQVHSSNNIEWSPDGTNILIETNQEGTLYLTLYDVETGEATNLHAASDYELFSFKWNPSNSNQFVLTSVQPNAIYFYIGDLENNELNRIGLGYASQWLNDGSAILVSRNDSFFVYDIESQEYGLLSDDAVSVSIFPDYQNGNFNLGSFLYYNGEETHLVIKSLDGMGGQTEIAGTNGAGIWSPNSRYIATKSYISSPHDYLLSVFTINGQLVLESQADQETSISWSPDSNFLVTDNWDADIFIINIDEQTETLIANGYSPSWSPDGNQIAFINSETFALEFFNASSLFD